MVKKRKHEASEPAKAEKAEISPINTASEIKFETSPASKKSKNSVSFKKSSSRKGSRSSDSKPQIKQEVSASQPPKPQNWQGPTTGHNFKIKQENALLDPCPICQNEIDHYTSIATPSTCLNHIFCVDCLLTWTKKSNICPMDRQPYDQVYIFESYYKKICQETDLKENGKNVEEFIQPDRILTVDKSGEKLKGDQAVDVIQSTPADQFVYSDDEELTAEETEAMIWENLFCLVCHDNDREEILLLCDGCDDCYHWEMVIF